MQKRVQNQMRISSKNEFFKLPFFLFIRNILFNKNSYFAIYLLSSNLYKNSVILFSTLFERVPRPFQNGFP